MHFIQHSACPKIKLSSHRLQLGIIDVVARSVHDQLEEASTFMHIMQLLCVHQDQALVISLEARLRPPRSRQHRHPKHPQMPPSPPGPSTASRPRSQPTHSASIRSKPRPRPTTTMEIAPHPSAVALVAIWHLVVFPFIVRVTAKTER